MFTLEQALSAIKDKPEFKVIEKKDYVVIDYMITTPTTFESEDALERIILSNLRGTAFSAKTGNIVSLPFHKFHNLGERPGYMHNELNFDNAETVMLKLDGSMIRTIRTEQESRGWVFGTRAGETDVSQFVDDYLVELEKTNSARYTLFNAFVYSMIVSDMTPIFEFTSRKNKVVVDYPEPELTLLAIRQNHTMNYVPFETLKDIAKTYNTPLVQTFNEFNEENVRKWKAAEGVVVSFPDGFRVKVKADDYVMKHRTKELIRFEKDVVSLCLQGKLDDILPLVSKEESTKLLDFSNNLIYNILEYDSKMRSEFVELKFNEMSDKDFALFVTQYRKDFAPFYFSMRKKFESGLREYIVKQTSSGPATETALKKFNLPRWQL